MKQKITLRFAAIAAILFILGIHASAQVSHAPSMQGPPVGPRDLSAFTNIVNIHGDDGFYLKKNLGLLEGSTIINGETVLGDPFLFPEWMAGIIITPDNRQYNYALRYNIYNQTISFVNGKDSLDVNEPVKEFNLLVKVNDTLLKVRLLNADQFEKPNKTLYYEVILDNSHGMLLKNSQKVIATLNSDQLLSSKGRKYFVPVFTYVYYNKDKKKSYKIKPAGSNIASILDLNDESRKALGYDSYDFTKEDDLTTFFQRYFKTFPLP